MVFFRQDAVRNAGNGGDEEDLRQGREELVATLLKGVDDTIRHTGCEPWEVVIVWPCWQLFDGTRPEDLLPDVQHLFYKCPGDANGLPAFVTRSRDLVGAIVASKGGLSQVEEIRE